MKRELKKINHNDRWYFDADGDRIEGVPAAVCGDLTSVWGDMTR